MPYRMGDLGALKGLQRKQTMREDLRPAVEKVRQPQSALADERKSPDFSRGWLKYIKNDTYVADPTAVLGKVYYEMDGEDKLIAFIIFVKGKVNEILTSRLAVTADIMSYLSLAFQKMRFLN